MALQKLREESINRNHGIEKGFDAISLLYKIKYVGDFTSFIVYILLLYKSPCTNANRKNKKFPLVVLEALLSLSINQMDNQNTFFCIK